MSRDISQEVLSGFSFTACINFVAIVPTTEHPFLLLKNPASSGKQVLITHLNFAVDSTVARSLFTTYIKPTITADGTALTINNMYAEGTPGVPIATAFKTPTISANGNPLSMKLLPADAPSTGQNRFIWLDESEELLLTVKNDTASIKTFVQIYWVEQ